MRVLNGGVLVIRSRGAKQDAEGRIPFPNSSWRRNDLAGASDAAQAEKPPPREERRLPDREEFFGEEHSKKDRSGTQPHRNEGAVFPSGGDRSGHVGNLRYA